jgi:hypothetical protein
MYLRDSGFDWLLCVYAGIPSDHSTGDRPVVYSLSPIYNQFRHRTGSMDSATTSLYHDEWKRMVAELDGDRLQIVGIDAPVRIFITLHRSSV